MFRRKLRLPVERNLFIAIVSGTEAGIATTAAIIAGTLTGTSNRDLVLVSTLVALAVQAFNSAMNHVTTARTDEEIDDGLGLRSLRVPVAEAGIQFGSHVLISLVVLSPIVWVTSLELALIYSMATALSLLFIGGLLVGFAVKHTPFRNAVRTMLFGALVISAGLVAGLIVQT